MAFTSPSEYSMLPCYLLLLHQIWNFDFPMVWLQWLNIFRPVQDTLFFRVTTNCLIVYCTGSSLRAVKNRRYLTPLGYDKNHLAVIETGLSVLIAAVKDLLGEDFPKYSVSLQDFFRPLHVITDSYCSFVSSSQTAVSSSSPSDLPVGYLKEYIGSNVVAYAIVFLAPELKWS